MCFRLLSKWHAPERNAVVWSKPSDYWDKLFQSDIVKILALLPYYPIINTRCCREKQVFVSPRNKDGSIKWDRYSPVPSYCVSITLVFLAWSDSNYLLFFFHGACLWAPLVVARMLTWKCKTERCSCSKKNVHSRRRNKVIYCKVIRLHRNETETRLMTKHPWLRGCSHSAINDSCSLSVRTLEWCLLVGVRGIVIMLACRKAGIGPNDDQRPSSFVVYR